MSIPVITSFQAFDATKDFDITFSYKGNQVYGNQIQIYDNALNEKVYDDTVTSFQLKHLITANTLTNGLSYYVILRVFDKNNSYSDFSSSVLFNCFLSPTFSIDITSNQIVENSYLDVNISYNSTDGELLNTWQISLYDSGNVLISITDIIYASVSLTTSVSGLINNNKYYIKATGVTLHGMELSTDLIPFNVQYIRPTMFSQVALTNNSINGDVEIQSYMASIEGAANPSPPTYIDDKEIDLTDSSSYALFNEHYNIEDNFTAEKLIRKINIPSVLDVFSNGSNTITLFVMKGTFSIGAEEQLYFLLNVSNGITNYRVATKPMDLPTSDSQQIYIDIRKKDNLYDIIAQYKT